MPRRWLLGGIVVVLTGLLGLAVFARGTWASMPRDPESVADEPLVQVVRLADGSRQVRAAVRLAYSPEEVWAAITDYDHYGEICSFLHAAEVDRGPDGCRAHGRVDTGLVGTLPYTLELKHCQELHEYTSTWDDPSDTVLVNRGGWQVRPVGDGETMLAVHLELQVRGVPAFLLRNLSRHRLPAVLRAVERRLADGPRGEPW